jgi:putative flippase GtrA
MLGGFSFLIEASLLYVITESGVHYLVSSAISFVLAFLIHFSISRKFIFKKSWMPFYMEMASYLGITLAGLALTVLCMYLFTEVAGIYYIISKALTTIVTLMWNYSIRKLWLYKQ